MCLCLERAHRTEPHPSLASPSSYLGLRNKSIFYDARRNETSLKGWFVFDGADYSRKTGRAITEELIEETESIAREERRAAQVGIASLLLLISSILSLSLSHTHTQTHTHTHTHTHLHMHVCT